MWWRITAAIFYIVIVYQVSIRLLGYRDIGYNSAYHPSSGSVMGSVIDTQAPDSDGILYQNARSWVKNWV